MRVLLRQIHLDQIRGALIRSDSVFYFLQFQGCKAVGAFLNHFLFCPSFQTQDLPFQFPFYGHSIDKVTIATGGQQGQKIESIKNFLVLQHVDDTSFYAPRYDLGAYCFCPVCLFVYLAPTCKEDRDFIFGMHVQLVEPLIFSGDMLKS